jgi:hypothetical protein
VAFVVRFFNPNARQTMMILHEEQLTLTQAARRVGVNPSTCWRWALNGVRGVKLETFSIGAQRFTTVEALERFIGGTTAAASNEPMPSVARTPRQREAAIRRAEKELAAEGI